MKPLLAITLAIALLSSCSPATPRPDSRILAGLVEEDRAPTIMSALLLTERDSFGHAWLDPIAPAISDAGRVAALRQALFEGESYDMGETPFIGHLCHVAFLDSSSEVVALVSIINSESRCIVSEASRDARGVIRFLPDRKRTGVQSDAFVEMIYEHLKATAPAYLEEQRALYASWGGSDIDLPALRTARGGRNAKERPTTRRLEFVRPGR